MKQKFPYLISILSVLGGVFISILFGLDEDIFKKRIEEGLNKNVQIQSIADLGEREKVFKAEKDKNWRYYQRYHFHANGIAALSLVFLFLLAFLQTRPLEKLICAYSISIGGFLYPFVWFFSAIYGPEWGRETAKETFAIFGYMGGVFFVGAFYLFYLVIQNPFKEPLNKA